MDRRAQALANMARWTPAEEPFFVERWGGDLIARELRAGDNLDAGKAIADGEGDFDFKRYTALWVIRATFTPEGERLFQDDDVQALLDGPPDDLEEAFKAVRRANHLGGESEKNS